MTLTFDLKIQIFFHHEFESGKIVFALWHRQRNFGIWVYHHEITCCIHSWPLYDLLSGWRGGGGGFSLLSFTQFWSCYDNLTPLNKTKHLNLQDENFIILRWPIRPMSLLFFIHRVGFLGSDLVVKILELWFCQFLAILVFDPLTQKFACHCTHVNEFHWHQ